MNFFTESVDAALWTSRTYDDPSYDDDPSAAAESRACVSVENHVERSPPSHMIVSSGGAADAALEALSPSGTLVPVATLSGAGVPARQVLMCTDGPLKGCATLSVSGVADDRAAMWAGAALQASGDAKIVVATSVPRAHMSGGGRLEMGVKMLASSMVQVEGLSKLCEPDFVSGGAAAVAAEAEWEGRETVCLVGVTERANFEVDEVIELAEAVCKAVTGLGGSASVGEEVRERVNKVAKKSAVAAHDSIYL